MSALRVCLVSFVLCSSVWAYRRPLGDFIKHYETLNYDSSQMLEHHRRVRRSNPYTDETVLRLDFKTERREFKLRLRRDVDLFTDDFQFNHPEFDTSKVLTGHVEGEKNSLVHGFISDDGVFEGKIHTGDDEFFVEPASKYFGDSPIDFHSVIYETRDVHYPHSYGAAGCGIGEKTKKWMDYIKRSAVKVELDDTHERKYEPVINRYRRATGDDIDPNKRSCTLKMMADHLFTNNMAGGNVERALLLMANHVQAANAIYKNTGFAVATQPEGYQFQIQRSTANTTADSKDSDNPYRDDNIGVEKLLEIISEEGHDEVCLAYVFTYRDFADGVLGLAWVGEAGDAAGGICQRSTLFKDNKRKSLNTGVVTFINYNKEVLPKVSQITFAHETGHNFGSPHDTTSACAPGGDDGNYIMFARATSGDRRNNRLFSECSREKMKAVIDVKGACVGETCCFKAPTEAICGNKIVEKGEQCDCGYQEDCVSDLCCFGRPTADTDPEGCKRRPGKTCSPSEGICCGVDCSPKGSSFLCLNETECANTSYCNGINATCPQPLPKDNLTECNEGRQVCLNGECSGSICLKFNLEECQCSQEEHYCDLCCRENNECKPTSKITQMEAKGKGIKLFPGAPCNDFNGYCDVFLKCRDVDADGPLSRLKNKFFSAEAIEGYIQWIKDHWWAVVLMGVGLILIMALFIKVCSVHTPSSNPNKKPARPMTIRRRPQDQRGNRQPPNRANRPPREPQPNNRGPPPPYYEMETH